jgi:multidrug efflux pump subunit AcrA (membrane-fusion protein)
MAKRTPLFLAFAIGVASGALGRLEPRNGVIDVAGPSDLSVVISHLPIDKGDPVEAGSLIAVLDKASVRKATVKRLEAELTHAKRERDRNLKNQAVISDSESDAREPAVTVATAASSPWRSS